MQTTGRIGSVITISGDDIYRISSVLFGGGVSGEFTENNDQLEVIVPEYSAWGYISVISSDRGLTGLTPFPFVPEPIINTFFPGTGLPGDTITIDGQAFSGVTGLTVNNLSGSFSVVSNTGITFTVPTGNAYGYIKVFGQSGVSYTSTDKFLPVAYVTGLSTYSAHTGTSIDILGTNFITDLLYNTTGSKYLVSFNGITGEFDRINITKLQGTIPYGAESGKVTVASNVSGIYHDSAATLNILKESPEITGIFPSSGITSGSVYVLGENFYDVTGVLLSGTIQVVEEIFTPYAGTGVAFDGGDYASDFFTIDARVYSYKTIDSVKHFSSNYLQLTYTEDGSTPVNYGIAWNWSGSTGVSGYRVLMRRQDNAVNWNYDHYRDTPTGGLYDDSYVSWTAGSTVTPTGGNTGIPVYDVYGNSDTIIGSLGDIIRFTSPALNPDSYSVIVRSSNGSYTGSNIYSALANPVIYGFSPTTCGSGTVVRITGAYLYPYVSEVYLNSVGMGSLAVTGSGDAGNYLDFIVPPTLSTGNTIIVYNSVGYASSGMLQVIPAPVISGISPTSGRYGSTVIVSGSDLNYVETLSFDGQSITFTGVGSTGIRFGVPYRSEDSTIYVTSTGGLAESETFYVLPDPIVVSGFSPTTLSRLDNLLISGTNMDTVTKVVFSGRYSGLAVVTGINLETYGTTGLILQVPLSAKSGNGKFLIYNDTAITTGSGLAINETPRITSFSPLSGIYGTTLSITGQYFTTGTKFYFKGVDTTWTSGLNQTYVSPTVFSIQVPKEIYKAKIAASGYGELIINQVESPTDEFTPLPSISGFTPSSITENSLITITAYNGVEVDNSILALSGSTGIVNFAYEGITGELFGSGTTNSYWKYSGIARTPFFTGGKLALVSKYHPDIESGNYINSNIFNSNILTITPATPVITNVTPTSGGANTLVTIQGRHLYGLTGVLFTDNSGTEATGAIISVTSNSEVVIKPHSSGVLIDENNGSFLDIFSRGGTTAYGGFFKFLYVPVITGLSATSCMTGRYFGISGSRMQYVTGVYIRNAFGGRTLISFERMSNFGISGLMPHLLPISDQDAIISLENFAGETVYDRGIKILNKRDVEEAKFMEAQVYLHSRNI
jgi:hypothetical protein